MDPKLREQTNTLSYAAPFKTIPPKPRGPAPYDAEDPRTWDHAKTVEWLTAQFTAQAMESSQADYNVKQRSAQLANKLKPLEPPAPGQLDLGVDIAKICPEGEGGKNLGMLYTAQFVQRCLEARVGEAMTVDKLKMVAMEIIGKLFYLTLTAKTKKRNEIMKSRKKLVRDDAYGDAPRREEEYDGAELLEARLFWGLDWQKTVVAACEQWKAEGRDWANVGYPQTIDSMMMKFREHKAAEAAVDDEGNPEGKEKEEAV
ncbi:hypothetical protein R3P38DRAFT_3256986 [Favolaschia claudopus]|uniref:Uncharacterized protein n=1 Tax=Favolaschia claudopus TaxID=2862362 RepID=A0AAW0D6B5_9AGAR